MAVRVAIALVLVLACVMPASAHVPDEPTHPMTCGTWTYYAPGVMKRVMRDRGMTPCGECDGIAATVDQRLIGARIEVWYSGAWRGVFLVVDVGDGRNRAGLVGEVSAEVAWSWGRAGPWWGCYRRSDER